MLRCRRCQYSTRDPRNLEMHVERHERMNEATREAGTELSTDAALRATTEAALKMMVANQVRDLAKHYCQDMRCKSVVWPTRGGGVTRGLDPTRGFCADHLQV